ncbi:porin [Cupriavidus basilensis]|uniref:Porin n=1 Tax=Cupriavidus basilensis TaxID=68895 RepID=A0A643FL21_9BURK|nr:porin [Cupriavidus basilensis]QOT80978.1 porin [Cupriavidus basilensis]
MGSFSKRSKIHGALIVAGAICTGGAHAQSSVTLYGVADMNVEFASHVGAVPSAANKFNAGPSNNVYRMDSGGLSGSRWGLRGVEDLGNGLNSLFVLESGFNLDTGTSQQGGRLFGRQAYVGMQSSQLGQLTFGRQYTSMFEGLANFVPAAFATQYEPIVMLTGANFREDNTIKYTGRFGPVTALAHWSFGTGLALPTTVANGPLLGGNGEVPGQFRRDTAYGAALTYIAGPVGVAVAYDQFNPTVSNPLNAAVLGSGNFKKATIAASYAFGPAKIMGGYRWGQNKDQNGSLLERDDLYWIGANYQLTPALGLTLEYNYDHVKRFFANASTPNPWQVAFIADYALSKRTDVYLTTAYAKNAGLGLDSAMIAYANSLSLGNSYTLASGQSNMLGVAAGIRHKF